MLENLESPWKYIVMALVFPIFFQIQLFDFVWGASDLAGIAIAKRILLLWPACAIIFCSWISVANIVSIVVRQQRAEFISAFFLTWWDLGRSIFYFWGGILRFILNFAGWIYGFIRLISLGFLLILKDFILFPIRAFSEVSSTSFRPGIPWPAIFMMIVWTIVEAAVFTFVMNPLVVDVMDSFSDGEFNGGVWLKIPLFVVFNFFVLGSYAVIHTFGEAIKARKWAAVIAYGLIELIVAAVETVLFYREFVDALVPWFAQYAGDKFELGVIGTLSIAFFVWFGIRCMTWFLFGASAIPMLLALIQRTGIDTKDQNKGGAGTNGKNQNPMLVYVHNALKEFRDEMDWVQAKGDLILSSFLIPPLQILAACINFCTLLFSGHHLFSLPFKTYKDILDTRDLLDKNRKLSKKE
ncbi:MAG: hypothetical protein NTX25_18075 [Proteobacteria bacterium]|nr:hypothetical protein [Pseudomonadota bacterium]